MLEASSFSKAEVHKFKERHFNMGGAGLCVSLLEPSFSCQCFFEPF